MAAARSTRGETTGGIAWRAKLLAVTVLAVCGVLGSPATAGAAPPARTIVTIRAQGLDLSGFVRSRNPRRCANNRVVTVYKQVGSRQNPRADMRIGSDDASLSGGRYMWSTGNTGVSGRVYAYARRIRGCRSGFSRTILAQPAP